jgi:hypothetical protein
MHNAPPPASSAPLQRSAAACLASILELDVAEVPVPEAEHPAPWTVWRNWLAQRRLGLVPIAEPARFNWPGPWIALLPAASGGGSVAVVAFGSPPGVVWNPLGGGEPFELVERGFVVAPADVALWAPAAKVAAPGVGTVEAIVIAPGAEAPTASVERAVARAGRGLEGDRYHDRCGTFTDVNGRGHDLTLVAAEELDALGLTPEEARRNVVTRGVDVNALVGRRFSIGGVACFGQRLCEPCAHLERLTRPGTLRALIHRGGLRVDVLGDGEIRAGDPVSAD